MVRSFGLLALEMGSQRANVQLESCRHGESIDTSELFAGDNASFESKVRVDLMTQPCLRRIGDGVEDLDTPKVIVKGSIVCIEADNR